MKAQNAAVVRKFVCGMVCVLHFYASSPNQPVNAVSQNWELMNGPVKLQDPLTFDLGNKHYSLNRPVLIGSGGGGSVFAFSKGTADPLVKISWPGSFGSVKKECQMLQLMEKRGIVASERCLGQLSYPDDPNRVMIVVQPYVPDAVSSVSELEPQNQLVAVKEIIQTLVHMLAEGIVTIDVQPLISKKDGNVIFIDMTEAELLRAPYSFMDRTLMSSFVTEMVTLIPESLKAFAKECARNEIATLVTDGNPLPMEVRQILDDLLLSD